MVKTRDFLLFVVTVVILLLAILLTLWHNARDAQNLPIDQTDVTLSVGQADTYEAVVLDDELNRATEIARMRAILAERDSVISSPEGQAQIEQLQSATTSDDTETLTDTEEQVIVLCDTYPGRTLAWPNATMQFEEREGARLVVYEIPAASTTQSITFWQLPLVSGAPPQQATCLDNEIVGIAKDGLPIKNSEHTLFTVFDANTQIGYARDGYPIYGQTDTIATDQCGGADTGSGYRYYLSSEREGVLGCFTGTPVSI